VCVCVCILRDNIIVYLLFISTRDKSINRGIEAKFTAQRKCTNEGITSVNDKVLDKRSQFEIKIVQNDNSFSFTYPKS